MNLFLSSCTLTHPYFTFLSLRSCFLFLLFLLCWSLSSLFDGRVCVCLLGSSGEQLCSSVCRSEASGIPGPGEWEREIEQASQLWTLCVCVRVCLIHSELLQDGQFQPVCQMAVCGCTLIWDMTVHMSGWATFILSLDEIIISSLYPIPANTLFCFLFQ